MASTRGLGPCSLGSSPNAPTNLKNPHDVDFLFK